MAGVITHLVIANEILKFLPEGTINNPGLFYLGSFAPDAIHARVAYVRAYKKHTHFRDDIPDGDFELAQNYHKYLKALTEFINSNLDRKDNLIDLYRGYVVHIITDELFMLTLRKDVVGAMEKQGIGQYEKPFFETIVADMNRNDLWLIKTYPEIEKLRTYMNQVKIYPIDGYITEEEMKLSVDWLLGQHFHKEQEYFPPVYIDHEKMQEFIQMAAKEISMRLTEGILIPRMI